MVNCPGEVAMLLALEPGGSSGDLNGPADLAVRRATDGQQLVVIPELFARDPTPDDDEVYGGGSACGFRRRLRRLSQRWAA
jgi:hypothetical protein